MSTQTMPGAQPPQPLINDECNEDGSAGLWPLICSYNGLTRIAYPINLDPEDEVDECDERRRSSNATLLQRQIETILKDPFIWIEGLTRRGTPGSHARTASSSSTTHPSRSHLYRIIAILRHAGNVQRVKADQMHRNYRSLKMKMGRKKPETTRAVLTLPRSSRGADPTSTQQNQQARARITCPICLENVVTRVTNCGHAYCAGCLQKWKDISGRRCPVCRKTLRGDHLLYI